MSIILGTIEILKLCYRKGGFMSRENLKKARMGKGMTQQVWELDGGVK